MRSYSAQDVEVFARGVPHPEGVAFDSAGWLYTGSSLPDHKGVGAIYRISPDGATVEKFADTGGRVLSLAFDQRGDLYVCDSKLRAVFRIEKNGAVHLFADYCGNRKILLPNFLVFNAEGCLYVSDSGTARAGEPSGAIFRFTPDGRSEIFVDGLIFTNGLALSSNEDALFVVETRDDRVLRVPIRRDGAAGKPEVYADRLQTGPDGLALDAAGNLYITVTRANQIVRVSPTDERVALVTDPTGERVYMPSN
ncbi:MAG: SMP-30/gluconolactonase/LRE family protein, partial [Chloroflexota bacterium]